MAAFDPDAYLENASQAQASFDPDAYLHMGDQDTVPSAPKEFGPNDPGTPHTKPMPSGFDTPLGVIANKAAHAVSYLPQKVAGGIAGIYRLATGQGVDAAAQSVANAQRFPEPNILPGSTADLTNEFLNQPGRIFKGAESGLQKLGVGPETAKAIPEAIGDMVGLLGTVKSIKAPIPQESPVGFEGMPAKETAPPASVSDQALSEGQKVGYVVPPATSNPSVFNRMTEGFAGKASVAQAASVKNQVITNSLARKALELPEDAPLTSDSLESIRQERGQTYGRVADTGTIAIDTKYHADLDALTKTSSTIQKSLPNYKSGAQAHINELVSSLRPEGGQLDSETAVELSKDLRYNSSANYAAAARTGDPSMRALASAQRDAAGAVEDQVGRHLESIGRPELATEWDSSRRMIAKTYSVQNALDGAGNVDAGKLGKQLIKGKPLSDELETAANFANAFPKATKVAAGKESMPGMSPLDVYGSVAASIATGNPTPLLLGPGRMAARAVALSKVGQKLTKP